MCMDPGVCVGVSVCKEQGFCGLQCTIEHVQGCGWVRGWTCVCRFQGCRVSVGICVGNEGMGLSAYGAGSCKSHVVGARVSSWVH